MTGGWSEQDLSRFAEAAELSISVRREDGTLRPPVTIWVVSTDGEVFVRTWHRRDHGWFGRVLSSQRARVAVPGLEADITIEDVGHGDAESRAAVDRAYRAEYARYGDESIERMTGDEAAATTLRLVRDASFR